MAKAKTRPAPLQAGRAAETPGKKEAPAGPVTLTAHQQQVLRFLQGWFADHSWPPTYREICQGMGWSSPNAAYSAVRILQTKGLVFCGANSARALSLTHYGKRYKLDG